MDSLIGLLIILGLSVTSNTSVIKDKKENKELKNRPGSVKIYEHNDSNYVNCYGWQQAHKGFNDGTNR